MTVPAIIDAATDVAIVLGLDVWRKALDVGFEKRPQIQNVQTRPSTARAIA
jgi:hypothetical protein